MSPLHAPTTTLAAYLHILTDANTQLNLTAIREPDLLLTRFIIEPLIGWRHLLSLLHDTPLPSRSLIDVGSGGGAPGLPIAIAAPDWHITLLEARRRKANFLRTTTQQLALTGTTVLHDRTERLAHAQGRERFGIAIARALAPLPVTLELLLPLVAVGGIAAVWSGPSAQRDFHLTERFAKASGGDSPQATTLHWPHSNRTLILVTVRKRRPSPKNHPRSLRRIRSALTKAATHRQLSPQ